MAILGIHVSFRGVNQYSWIYPTMDDSDTWVVLGWDSRNPGGDPAGLDQTRDIWVGSKMLQDFVHLEIYRKSFRQGCVCVFFVGWRKKWMKKYEEIMGKMVLYSINRDDQFKKIWLFVIILPSFEYPLRLQEVSN